MKNFVSCITLDEILHPNNFVNFCRVNNEIIDIQTMKKVLIIVLALILAGCQGGYGGGSQAYKEVNYRTGTEGAAIEFVQNAPGSTIDEESTFPIQVRVHNQGAYEILPENNEQVYLKINKDNYFIQGKADEFVTVTPLRAKSDAYPSSSLAPITGTTCTSLYKT